MKTKHRKILVTIGLIVCIIILIILMTVPLTNNKPLGNFQFNEKYISSDKVHAIVFHRNGRTELYENGELIKTTPKGTCRFRVEQSGRLIIDWLMTIENYEPFYECSNDGKQLIGLLDERILYLEE